MSKVIVLKAECGYGKSDINAEGITTTSHSDEYENKEGVMTPFEWKEHTLPELGPKRVFTGDGPMVLPIAGRRWLISFTGQSVEEWGSPEPGTVVFSETDLPETPFEVWDNEAENHKSWEQKAAHIVDSRGWYLECIEKDPDHAEQYRKDLERLDKEEAQNRKEMEAKAYTQYFPRSNSAFGQPSFIQNAVCPAVDGKAAFHLLTLETGWGDSGNENYMVSLDEDGYPCAVFHEASCC